jgi:hypothetical protein
MLDERIAPYVPREALQRPTGAVVNDGMVTCVSCQAILPVAKADIVGLGYRCVPCGHKAHLTRLTGGGDAASHFTEDERDGLRASGDAVMWAGIGITIASAIAMAALMLKLGTAGLLIGVITIIIGVARRNAAT